MNRVVRISLVVVGLASVVYGTATLTGGWIGTPSRCANVDQALARLRSAEPAARYEAVVQLGMLPPSDARREGLARAVRDSDPEVRLMAAIVIVGDGSAAHAVSLSASETTRSLPSRTPNPPKSVDLSPAEQLVSMDPWFAGALLPGARVAIQSRDSRVRALGQRAAEQMKQDGPSRPVRSR